MAWLGFSSFSVEKLVIARGRDFPIARLADRCWCPRCGSRKVRLVFDSSGEHSSATAYYAALYRR